MSSQPNQTKTVAIFINIDGQRSIDQASIQDRWILGKLLCTRFWTKTFKWYFGK